MKAIYLVCFLCWIVQLSAQFQNGMSLSPWLHQLPEHHNMSMMYFRALPSMTFYAGSRLDGFDGHPFEATFLMSGYLDAGLGAGFQVSSSSSGLLHSLDAQLALAYFVFINKQQGDKLAFSLGGHFQQYRLTTEQIIVLDQDDPALQAISQVHPTGNASASIAFVRENKFYVGLSSYHLLERSVNFLQGSLDNYLRRHYYMLGGYMMSLSEVVQLDTYGAFMLMHDKYSWLGGLSLKINKNIWFGAGYRSIGALQFDAGITAQSWSFGFLSMYGFSVDATRHTYNFIYNSVFIRKLFPETMSNL